MNELQRSAILLSLIEHLRLRGSWCGEIHVQKATYFLQELMHVPLNLNFIFYRYGPYSFDLHDQIVAMRADSLLELISSRDGPSLRPGELVYQLKRRCPKILDQFGPQVAFVADKLSEKRVSELEALSTALYTYINDDGERSKRHRVESVQKMKPNTNSELAEKAVEELDKLFSECRNYHNDHLGQRATVRTMS